MASRHPIPPPGPPALHDRAMDNLRFIRETMERASSFTAVPGWGAMLIGASAVATALAAGTPAGASRWRTAWLVEAFVAIIVGIVSMRRKARAAGVKLYAGPGRRFILSLVPPLLAGAVLTIALNRIGQYRLLPGLWLLLYGTGVVTGGAFSVRIVPLMGIAFMGFGCLALALSEPWPEALMGLGFGGLHLCFGAIIARRSGG